MKYKKWTEEDHELIKIMSEAGYTAREIATELDCSENTIKHKKVVLGISTRANSYKSKDCGGSSGLPPQYTKEQLIKWMQEAPLHTYDYFNSKESSVPSATTYRRYFGSWQAALEAAGIQPNKSSMDCTRPTKVYLVDFGDFYKVGITQQTLKQRFKNNYPKYEVVLEIDTTYEEAKAIEKQWLEAVKQFKYIPDSFPIEGRGFTECFKFE